MKFTVLIVLMLSGLGLTHALAEPLIQDPNWQEKSLDNGFKYHLYDVDESSDRVQIYLWVKAGSLDETPAQKGGAHLLEHMALNGTKHFPGLKIIELFRQAGLKYGKDLNAYVNYHHTVYTLSVPENMPELMSEALFYLSDIAQHITLDKREVEKEKGVVKAEYYSKINRLKDSDVAYREFMSQGSEYTFHNVLGTLTQIEALNSLKLRAFYQKWYRPDNMELLVVGNFDKTKVSLEIKQRFAPLEGKAPPKLQPKKPVFLPRAFTFSSERVTQSRVSLNYPLPKLSIRTKSVAKKNTLFEFCKHLLNLRLLQAHVSDNQPFDFVSAYIDFPHWEGNQQVYALEIGFAEEKKQKALHWLAAEILKIRQYGFSQQELEQLKAIYWSRLQQFNLDVENQASVDIISQHLSNLQSGQVTPDSVSTLALFEDFIQQVSLSEVNQFVKEVLDKPQVYYRVKHEGSNTHKSNPLMASEQIDLWVAQAFSQKVSAYEPSELAPLIVQQNTKAAADVVAKPVSSELNEKWGLETLKFENGLHVQLQTDSQSHGRVYYQLSAPGGKMILAPKYRVAAALLTDMKSENVLSETPSIQVTQTSFKQFINLTRQGFEGSTVSDELDFAMENLSHFFTSKKLNKDDFGNVKNRMHNNVGKNIHSPQGQIDALYYKALYGDNPYFGYFSLEQIEHTDMDDLHFVHQALFGSITGFTLTLVGDFEPQQAKNIIAAHFGSLSSGKRHRAPLKPMWAIKQKAEINQSLSTSDNATVTFQFVYHGLKPSVKQIYGANIISRLLKEKLNQEIREEQSLAYSPHGGCNPAWYGISFEHCRISFVADPNKTDLAKEAVENMLSALYQQGISESSLSMHKKGVRVSMLEQLKDPSSRTWLIHRDQILGFEVGQSLAIDSVLASIDKAYIDELIQVMLKDAGQVTLINNPQPKSLVTQQVDSL